MTIQPRRWAVSIICCLVLASAAAIASSWSTVVIDAFYEDWTASQYPSRIELLRKKRSPLLPGPTWVETEITFEQLVSLDRVGAGNMLKLFTPSKYHVHIEKGYEDEFRNTALYVVYLSPDSTAR